VAREGGWPVGKKPVIKLLGLNGGGVDSAGLLDGSVDSEKAAGERDVVGGRHCARLIGWGRVLVEETKLLLLEWRKKLLE
jgi:hypothetical protein